MRSRRPALILLVVMVLVVSALNASDRDRSGTAPTPAASSAPPQEPAGREVRATLPAEKPVQARVGDTVILRVRSERPDIAEILAVGARTPVGPELPGELRFVAQTSGEIPVDLEVAGSTAGVVRITEPAS